jgi:hypothetical protein
MIHSTKIGIVIKDGLPEWQKLNVTAFLASGIAASAPECIGEPYEDGSDNKYISLFGQPVFVYIASSEHLQRTRARALSREVAIAIYTQAMFSTDNDVDNRATVKAVAAEGLNLVGLALRTDSKVFDKIINGLKLHP